jgi:exosortase
MSDREFVQMQKVRAVILAGTLDFGRYPLASHLPTALWPVAGKPVLEHLLSHLAKQGIKKAVICSNCDGALLTESIHADDRLELKFLDERLPTGAAGCIAEAAAEETGTLFLVLSVNIVTPPEIDSLVKAHQAGRSDLTMMFNPAQGNRGRVGDAADIYMCNPSVLEHIPRGGYFDIKEELIPRMRQAGKTVAMARLPKPVGNFRDWREYLSAIGNYLKDDPELGEELKLRKQTDSAVVWAADTAYLDPGAQSWGTVALLEGAQISKDAVLIGPVVIGRDVSIGEGSLIAKSVLWDDVQIGSGCEIQRCLIDNHAVVPPNTVVEDKFMPHEAKGRLKSLVNTATIVKGHASKLRAALQPQLARIKTRLPGGLGRRDTKLLPWLAAFLVVVAFLWSYWPGIVELWSVWQRSDEYSSGLLVPFLAAYILWSRRDDLLEYKLRPCLWAICVFMAAQAIRIFGQAFMYGSAENLSIALTIAALVLLLFGWQLFKRVLPLLLFLCLMLPWPNGIQSAFTLPLQRWATSSAVFCLETLGYQVTQEGNVINIGSASVAVAEACNGLRMVTAFFVISGLVVLLIKRAWWEKLIVFVSSLPIALLCNTTRLAITALAFTVVSGEYWEKVFHDFGGYAMMPLALAIVIAELWILTKLTVPPERKEGIIIVKRK